MTHATPAPENDRAADLPTSGRTARHRVAFETLGCRLNQSETATMTRQFLARGYEWVKESADADLCIINTCSLTAQATNKCRRLIRSLLRRNPSMCIAAVGCYAQTGADTLQSIDGLDYIIGTSEKMRIAEIIQAPTKLPRPMIVAEKASRERFTIPEAGYYPLHTRANLKIQEGCNFVCSFCIIPRSRGPARSRDFEDLLREARVLVSEGHRELIITGINVGTYADNGRTLVDVVDAMGEIDGLDRIRLSSIEPTTIEDGLIDRMADGGKLCPYLHIPLQSGDDEVLGRMRRRYTVAEYRAFLDDVRRRVPQVGLGTDVIVGFPGENDAAFANSCRVVRDIEFNNIHVFSFSAREGTGALRMTGRVPGEVVADRSRHMHRLAEEARGDFYLAQVGREHRVLFEERDSEGRWIGFSDNYVKVAVATPRAMGNRIGRVHVSSASAPAHGRPWMAVGDPVDIENDEPRRPIEIQEASPRREQEPSQGRT